MLSKKNSTSLGLDLVIALQAGFLYLMPAMLNAEDDNLAAKQREIAQELVCLCGCGNMIMETCTCGEATANKKYIREQLKAGRTESEIYKHFVDKYGEQVMAAPTREGFNWVVWLIPYVVPLLGAAGVGILLAKWTRRRKTEAEQATAEVADNKSLDKYDQQVEDELKKLD